MHSFVMRASILLATVVTAIADPVGARPISAGKAVDTANQPALEVKRLLGQTEDQIDFAGAKLTIDRLIDPATDSVAAIRDIDRLVLLIKSRTPPGLDHRGQMDVLISTLYEPGPWNNYKVYSYDLDDHTGKDRRTRRLSHYLHTKKGNCVSMPILVAALAQRLGFIVTLAITPGHIIVKFVNDNGQWLNVEATSGEYVFDSAYERDTQITPLALKNEIYLRPLSPREAVGTMASTLMEELYRKKQGDELMAVAQAVLEVNPKDIMAILQMGNAYGLQADRRYRAKYRRPIDIPVTLRADFARLTQGNRDWFAKAERLGWKPTTKEYMDNYLASIAHEKAKRTKEGKL